MIFPKMSLIVDYITRVNFPLRWIHLITWMSLDWSVEWGLLSNNMLQSASNCKCHFSFFYDRIKDFFGGFHNWIATSKQQEKEKDPVRLSEKNESPVIEKGQDNNMFDVTSKSLVKCSKRKLSAGLCLRRLKHSFGTWYRNQIDECW